MTVKLSIKFHPLLFQSSLAAGGVALMAFNYLQFAVPHGKGLITLSDISWGTLTTGQVALYAPLVAVLFVFTVLNLRLNVYFLYRLARWLREPGAYRGFKNNPHQNQNAGIFAIVASLSMTRQRDLGSARLLRSPGVSQHPGADAAVAGRLSSPLGRPSSSSR